MKTKHTKGPWKIKEGTIHNHVISGNGEYIAGVQDGINDIADAQLIAAAPELLEALKQLVSAHNSGDWRNIGTAKNYAKQAIAKAEGN